MRSDVVIEGKHANIINDIKETRVLKDSTADIFFIATLIGLFNGNTAEDDIDDNIKVEVTRTWLNSSHRTTLKMLINTFVNLQSKMDNEPLSLSEIFHDEKTTNSSEKVYLIKKYALRGLELMEKEYFKEHSLNHELNVINFISNNLFTEEEIKKKANSVEFSSFSDDDLLDLVESMDDN